MFQTALYILPLFDMFFLIGFIKYKKAYLVRYAFFQSDSKLEFCTGLICHKVYSRFNLIVTQAAVAAFGRH